MGYLIFYYQGCGIFETPSSVLLWIFKKKKKKKREREITRNIKKGQDTHLLTSRDTGYR